MLHYQVVRTSPGGATLSNKMNNTVHYGHVRHISLLALMCAKNHLRIFSSSLDIWENVEWPRFLDHPVEIALSCVKLGALVGQAVVVMFSFFYMTNKFYWFLIFPVVDLGLLCVEVVSRSILDLDLLQVCLNR